MAKPQRVNVQQPPKRLIGYARVSTEEQVHIADPGLSLRDIAAQLDQMGERPARGGRKWQTSSVRDLLDEAHRFGLIRS